jgi:hypothetical protein
MAWPSSHTCVRRCDWTLTCSHTCSRQSHTQYIWPSQLRCKAYRPSSGVGARTDPTLTSSYTKRFSFFFFLFFSLLLTDKVSLIVGLLELLRQDRKLERKIVAARGRLCEGSELRFVMSDTSMLQSMKVVQIWVMGCMRLPRTLEQEKGAGHCHLMLECRVCCKLGLGRLGLSQTTQQRTQRRESIKETDRTQRSDAKNAHSAHASANAHKSKQFRKQSTHTPSHPPTHRPTCVPTPWTHLCTRDVVWKSSRQKRPARRAAVSKHVVAVENNAFLGQSAERWRWAHRVVHLSVPIPKVCACTFAHHVCGVDVSAW